MKAINIFTLTRIEDRESLQKLERQMSRRRNFLTIKEWEIEGLRKLIEQLVIKIPTATRYEFYYSFQLPKLGKEFDLLRISEDYVVNIELKSGNVSDEAVRKQLLQNRYYLMMLGKVIYSYTYISSQNRLVRLSKSGKLVETDWDKLCEDLLKQKECLSVQIEDLFREEKFLISPLADPDKFLRKEYYLTYQQRDIKKQIISKVSQKGCSYQCFTGLPGTGKTLLLYDIAMQLSWKEKVCILHFGTWSKEIEQLNQRLKRIDFINCDSNKQILLDGDYAALCIDDGHQIQQSDLKYICDFAEKFQIPVIFSYDLEDAMAPQERSMCGAVVIESLERFTKYRLTNRIRVNSESSSFIHSLMHAKRIHYKEDYPEIQVAYANNKEEASIFLNNYMADGYVYIRDNRLDHLHINTKTAIEVNQALSKDFERVVMLLDESFRYTDDGYLVSDCLEGEINSKVRCLFHGLNRAKQQIALVVKNNSQVFDTILHILQRK